MKSPIYLDYNATTPLDPEVFQSMRPYLEADFWEPLEFSTLLGWEAQIAVKKARRQVAELIGASEREIVWTSGATESNNMALLGCVRHWLQQRRSGPPM